MSQAAQTVGVLVRLPVPLRDWLKERAARNRRSANGELTVLIERQKAAEEAEKKNPAHP